MQLSGFSKANTKYSIGSTMCNRAVVSLILEMVSQSPASYLHSSLGCSEGSDINYSSDDSRDPRKEGSV